jgi:hypothetical protein
MTQSLIPATLSTYAEQVKEVLAVGGDPSFLSDPNPNNNGVSMWDGTIDESAYFGGWEETEAGEAAATTTTTATATTTTSAYTEQLERAVNAVGGDSSFLLPHTGRASSSSAEPWDGTVDEAAHFGGWEN